ncbi:hypothetical protein [uncultured Chitinophaga sp.]|uniref:hypothetical protein n=1 Tax=uncultured Chitinophaga sp. TaxID=339340 RepID=UPI0025E36168|nr:hypothetical protein [uncultured Chitinophaga sp.]
MGGVKGNLLSRLNILEGNHIPTMRSINIAGFKISDNSGSVFQMLYEDHRPFISTGSSKAAAAFRHQEADLLGQGKFMEAFDLTVDRVKAIHRDKYNDAMTQARDYYQKNIEPQLQQQLQQKQATQQKTN